MSGERATEAEKVRARVMAQKAVRKGRLERRPCEWETEVLAAADKSVAALDAGAYSEVIVCGVEKTDAHHDDYRKPLDVRWLCRRHHRAAHDAVKSEPAPLAPGAIVSLRQFRDIGSRLEQPIYVARNREIIGAWIPGWMLDELDVRPE